MPKLKSNRAAMKRFKITGRGKIKSKRAYLRHMLTKKSKKRKRHLRRPGIIKGPDEKRIRLLIPYS
ncbi:MAG: 50S ribosomal protein L35 [Candidatus Glassbacteria bacterium]